MSITDNITQKNLEHNKIEHPLAKEPEYLTTFEVVTSYGFLKIMSIVLMPGLLALIIFLHFKKKIKSIVK